MESEIDSARIYRRVLVEGDLNKQTQKEIAEAVQRAKQAYEIATQSLFRDVSSYSFDSYRKELASDLTLGDLSGFAERFLSKHRRQLQQKDSFLEFLVPDVLEPFGLPERYRNATFDRHLAIKRTDAEFFALGHPFVDAMLAYSGSYDFGGLTAIRHISSPEFARQSGFLFIFIVRQRITRGGGDECLFHFHPVFVTKDGLTRNEFVDIAVNGTSLENSASTNGFPPDPAFAFAEAKKYVENEIGLWDWVDDVEFLCLSWVEFE